MLYSPTYIGMRNENEKNIKSRGKYNKYLKITLYV